MYTVTNINEHIYSKCLALKKARIKIKNQWFSHLSSDTLMTIDDMKNDHVAWPHTLYSDWQTQTHSHTHKGTYTLGVIILKNK